MNRVMIKAKAREELAGNWSWAVLLGLAYFVVGGILEVITNGFGTIIVGILEVGYSLAFLHFIDKRKDDNIFSALFSGVTEGRFLPVLINWLLKVVFLSLWSLLLVVPGIIKGYAYAMSDYIIDDLNRQGRSIQPTEAITKSRQLMDGHKLDLFIFDLSFIGWYILSLFTLGIGLLWLVPYYRAAHASYYRNLADWNPDIINA